MANRISQLFSRVRNWKWSESQSRQPVSVNVSHDELLTRTLGPYEQYVIKIQSIIVWENPVISWFCVVGANFVFWLILNYECRFYGLLFTFLFVAFVYNMWCDVLRPAVFNVKNDLSLGSQERRNQRVLTVPELRSYLNQCHCFLMGWYTWLRNFRDEQPGMFCCCMCLCFVIMSAIGRTVPGVVIAYSLVMFCLVAPGIYVHLLPPVVVERLTSIFLPFKLRNKDADSDVDEYLPEQSGENLALLHHAVEPIDESVEEPSIPEEFGLEAGAIDAVDMSVVPSHDDGSIDELDVSEFDLSPSTSMQGSNSNNLSRKKRELEVDSSESEVEVDDLNGIHFQSSHFNGDSSEEDEAAFTQGLTFSELNESKVAESASPSLRELLVTSAAEAVTRNIKIGQSFVASVIAGATSQTISSQHQKKDDNDSSSDVSDDFELISQDELN